MASSETTIKKHLLRYGLTGDFFIPCAFRDTKSQETTAG